MSEQAADSSPALTEARHSGEPYLLSRALMRRLSTGELVDPAYLDRAFPYYWHYDVLRALDYFRRTGAAPDPQLAADLVRRSSSPTGGGCSTSLTPAASISPSNTSASRADGTPCASSPGGTAARRHEGCSNASDPASSASLTRPTAARS